jgi:hypothetical protein
MMDKLPTDQFISLDAFNVVPGATFIDHLDGADDTAYPVWIVDTVRRIDDAERIVAIAHRGDNPDLPTSEYHRLFRWHYLDKVMLIGLVVHPHDLDDNNWGNVNAPQQPNTEQDLCGNVFLEGMGEASSPCVLDANHGGDEHQDASGGTWLA